MKKLIFNASLKNVLTRQEMRHLKGGYEPNNYHCSCDNKRFFDVNAEVCSQAYDEARRLYCQNGKVECDCAL